MNTHAPGSGSGSGSGPDDATGLDGTARDGWHLTDGLVAAYAEHSLDDPAAWSVETHLEACGPCAALVSAAVRATPAGEVLAALRTGLLAQLAPTHRAAPTPRRHRLWWSAGPALRGPWLGSLLLLVVAAPVLAYGAGIGLTRSVLLVLAPVLPVAAVAVSYGRAVDPLYEIGAASPRGGLRLLLTRTALALAVCVPLLTATGAVLPPGRGGPAAAVWLLPGLALTLGTLALGSLVGCRTAAAVTGAGWLLAVALPTLAAHPPRSPAEPHALTEVLARYVDGAGAQVTWAAAAALGAGLLALRRTAFDRGPAGGGRA